MDIAVPEMPINLLSVPGGRIAVKVSVPARPPVHAVLPAEKIVENLQAIEQNLGIERRNRYMAHQHAMVCASIVATVTDHIMTEEVSIGVAVAALWLAMNHPREREEMRKALGTYLRSSGRGCIALEAFADQTFSLGVAPDPIADAQLERAKTDAAALNAEVRTAAD